MKTDPTTLHGGARLILRFLPISADVIEADSEHHRSQLGQERTNMIIGPTDNPIQRPLGIACAALLGLAGCAAGARLQLSAADSLHAIMTSVQLAATEYHDEIRSADALRRQWAIDAFVQRLRDDHDDQQAAAEHVARFNLALDRLLQDGETESARYLAAMQNIRTLAEIGDGLKRHALQSLTLDDELRRYIDDLLRPVDLPNPQPSTPATDGP